MTWQIIDTGINFTIVYPVDEAIQWLLRRTDAQLVDIKLGSVTPAHTEQTKNGVDYLDTVFQRGIAPAHANHSTRPTLIEQIKARHPIAPHVARYTNGLHPSNGWFVGRCPFHQPETDPPSKRKFWVNIQKGICGCFVPRCPGHQPMDIINFEALRQGITNGEAIARLSEELSRQ